MKAGLLVLTLGLTLFSFLIGYITLSRIGGYSPEERQAVNAGQAITQPCAADASSEIITGGDESTTEEDRVSTAPFLPFQPWERPGTCDLRPKHMPDYCCYGGKNVYAKYCQEFNQSTFDRFDNHTKHYVEHTRHAFFNSQTSSPSPCNECQIANYVLKHNLTLTFLGDSVMDQNWVGLECSLRRRGYHFQSKTLNQWARQPGEFFKNGLRDVQTLKLVGGPGGVTGEGILAYVKAYRRPTYGAEFFYVIANSDVIVFDHGVHWQPKLHDEFRLEMVEHLKHFRTPQAAHVRLLAWRETTPQHWNYPGGYYAVRYKSGISTHKPFLWRIVCFCATLATVVFLTV